MKISTQVLLLASLALLMVVGCNHKKIKPDGDVATSAATELDQNTIAQQDIKLDNAGSDTGKIDGLSTVHFDYDKSSLSEEARQTILKDVEWMKKHPESNLEIQGHCDRHGSTEYNLSLGERRAKTVLTYMTNLGVTRDRLTTISYGKEKPLNQDETEAADSQNRRANFRPMTGVKMPPMSQR